MRCSSIVGLLCLRQLQEVVVGDVAILRKLEVLEDCVSLTPGHNASARERVSSWPYAHADLPKSLQMPNKRSDREHDSKTFKIN